MVGPESFELPETIRTKPSIANSQVHSADWKRRAPCEVGKGTLWGVGAVHIAEHRETRLDWTVW